MILFYLSINFFNANDARRCSMYISWCLYTLEGRKIVSIIFENYQPSEIAIEEWKIRAKSIPNQLHMKILCKAFLLF